MADSEIPTSPFARMLAEAWDDARAARAQAEQHARREHQLELENERLRGELHALCSSAPAPSLNFDLDLDPILGDLLGAAGQSDDNGASPLLDGIEQRFETLLDRLLDKVARRFGFEIPLEPAPAAADSAPVAEEAAP